MLVLSQVAKEYWVSGTCYQALQAISLTVDAGDMLAVVGASGSGKSTLMNIFGLLDTLTQGSYRIQGQAVEQLTDSERASLRNRCFGFIFQQFNLLPHLTALQNVALPLTYRTVSTHQAKQQALAALDRVGMVHCAEHRPNQLSGGQQQRVAIARALVGEPSIILADEPTASLDEKTTDEIMTLFSSLHQEGRTLILVTHNPYVAKACSKLVSLERGRLC